MLRSLPLKIATTCDISIPVYHMILIKQKTDSLQFSFERNTSSEMEYKIISIVSLFFGSILNDAMSNHISSLFFEIDSFYSNYNTTTIIVPLHLNTIQLRMGHLITQLKDISKLPIILNSRFPLKFMNRSLQDLTHLHDETRNLMELLKSRQIQRDFFETECH